VNLAAAPPTAAPPTADRRDTHRAADRRDATRCPLAVLRY
jgi:hypothetical protein